MEQDNKKQQFIQYLTYLSRKRTIHTRQLFTLYIQRLESNKYLTDRMIDHIIMFMKYDYKMTEPKLREYLNEYSVTYWIRQSETQSATLEQFL